MTVKTTEHVLIVSSAICNSDALEDSAGVVEVVDILARASSSCGYESSIHS